MALGEQKACQRSLAAPFIGGQLSEWACKNQQTRGNNGAKRHYFTGDWAPLVAAADLGRGLVFREGSGGEGGQGTPGHGLWAEMATGQPLPSPSTHPYARTHPHTQNMDEGQRVPGADPPLIPSPDLACH